MFVDRSRGSRWVGDFFLQHVPTQKAGQEAVDCICPAVASSSRAPKPNSRTATDEGIVLIKVGRNVAIPRRHPTRWRTPSTVYLGEFGSKPSLACSERTCQRTATLSPRLDTHPPRSGAVALFFFSSVHSNTASLNGSLVWSEPDMPVSGPI